MHREKYYTRENIAAEAAGMAAELPVNPRAAALLTAQAALLVIDMQDYFLSPESHAFLPAAPAIIPNVRALAKSFQEVSRPVYFTRHGNSITDAGQMAAWWRELLTPDHPLGAITAVLRPSEDSIIKKTQYDAFFRTDLEERLRRDGIGQLVVTGVATHLCCESTARSAFARGFAPFVVIDGTASFNRELHVASLRSMAHGCAVPILAAGVTAALGGIS
jgi:isochorismate hydrolase